MQETPSAGSPRRPSQDVLLARTLTHTHPYRSRPTKRHLIAGVLTIIWPYTRGTAALVTIAITGASSSAMIALGDCANVGRRTGMYLTIVSLGVLAGPLISGAISHSTGGYTGIGFFAGA
jgi:hypothetical protein